MFCPKCGKETDASGKFCQWCGADTVGPIVASLGMLIIVIPWVYFAGFESSRSQATPGKVLVHAVVTDLDGDRVSFARATLRHFGKFISLLIIFIGFLMIAFTKKKQGLHDKIGGCLVLRQD
ncbi:MAG: RDD family protein [Methanoregula sp.]|nr:RDD family protein [Methanoregula sp.]